LPPTRAPAPAAKAAGSAAPADGAGSSSARRPGPPPKTVDLGRDSEQQRYVESLQRRVGAGRRRSWLLAVGAAAAVLLALLAGIGYWAASVLRYAPLDDELRVERSATNPDRIALVYRPLGTGTVGFRRADAGRQTELLDQVQPADDGSEQRFEWRLADVQEGDVVGVTFRRGFRLTTAELRVPATPAPLPLGDAMLVGEVVNAKDNRPVTGAEVRLVGTPLRGTTDDEGRFRITEAPAGPVAIEVSAAGFSTDQLEQELTAAAETPLRVALSPGLEAGQIRVVLTWNDDPQDLDAHLEGPLADGARFHVSFQDKGDLEAQEFVSLDIDDRNGRGPETITVLGVRPGTYHYFVHDFTNKDDLSSGALARSGGEVKVYQRGQSYRFRANNEATGNVWHVCDIVVTDEGAEVRRVDQYESKQLHTTPPTDLAFLIDVTASTRDRLPAIQQQCLRIAETLVEHGVDARFALVGFGDSKLGEPLAVEPLTADVQAFRAAVGDLAPSEGGDLPESCVAALERAVGLDYRADAARSLVVFTDAPTHQAERIAGLARQLAERKITVAVFGHPADRALYEPLCAAGGSFQAMFGDESAEGDAGETSGGDSGFLSDLLAQLAASVKPAVEEEVGIQGTAEAEVAGEVVNALDNTPLAGVEVRIAGTELATTSDAQGKFRFPAAPSGTLHFEADKTGFSTARTSRLVARGESNFVRLALSPVLGEKQMRFVLTWGQFPSDLDSHLYGPLPNGEFHIWYRNKGTIESKRFVNLDVDDTTSYGPETTTVQGLLPGTYRYLVHDYSNLSNPDSEAMCRSGAEVHLYLGDRELRFAANGRSAGTAWHVCNIEVDDNLHATVRPIDQYQRDGRWMLAARSEDANRIRGLAFRRAPADQQRQGHESWGIAYNRGASGQIGRLFSRAD
jgi:uncharacterized protein YfaP (DUF2135 family)